MPQARSRTATIEVKKPRALTGFEGRLNPGCHAEPGPKSAPHAGHEGESWATTPEQLGQ